MDYSVFENCRANKRADETDDRHMERIIRSAFVPSSDADKRINDMLGGSFYACSYENKTLTLEFRVQDWMRNPAGTLHGGLYSTTMDMTMGLVTRYFKETKAAVTVSLSVDFLRSLEAGAAFRVTAAMDKAGKQISFLHAMAEEADSGKPAATAKATFM